VQPGEQPLSRRFPAWRRFAGHAAGQNRGQDHGLRRFERRQGSPEQGIRILTTYFANLAAYDAANANGGLVAQTVGAARAAQLGAKQAHMARQCASSSAVAMRT